MKRFIVIFILLFYTFILSAQPHEYVRVDSILIKGNEKTKSFVILRELNFKIGDTLNIASLPKIVSQNKSNLMNTALFNFADIYYQIKKDVITFTIELTEQWYFWIFPIVEIADRNPNEWWESKDFRRIDYGVYFEQENFRGNGDMIKLKAVTGYNRYVDFEYTKPFIGKKTNLGLFLDVSYLQNHETAIDVRENKLLFFSHQDQNVLKKYTIRAGMTYRRKLVNTHTLTLQYNFYDYHDSISQINPKFFNNHSANIKFLTLGYSYTSEHRDFISYPLKGYYLNLSIAKEGLFSGISSIKNWRFKATYNKYWALKKHWYFSSGVSTMLTNDNEQPFFLNQGIGYNKLFVRGYENYVVYGNSYVLSRNNLKFELLNKKIYLKAIPLKQFNSIYLALYLNVFTDFGYVDGFDSWQFNNNTLPNTFLFGKGIGLDVVTYYEFVFRFEYSFDKNNHGGFFFHLQSSL